MLEWPVWRQGPWVCFFRPARRRSGPGHHLSSGRVSRHTSSPGLVDWPGRGSFFGGLGRQWGQTACQARAEPQSRRGNTAMRQRGVRGRRLPGLVRLWRPDGNPLRRTADRVEGVVIAVLVAAFLTGAPLAALAAGHAAAVTG